MPAETFYQQEIAEQRMKTLITGRSRRTVLFPAQQNNPLNFNTIHGNNIRLQIHFFFLKYMSMHPAIAPIDDKT